MIPDLKITIWSILTGILTAFVIILFLTRKSKLEKAVNKRKYLAALIFNIVVLNGLIGAGYYFLLSPQISPDISAIKFPSTGLDPAGQTFFGAFKGLFATPADGIISIFLLISIVFLAKAVMQNILDRKHLEKELGNAKIAARNVLEDLQAEEKITKQSEVKYRNLVDIMGEGLGVQDKNGIITFMNRRGCEMLGYTLEELLGKPAEFVFDEENRKILREQMQKRKTGEHQSYEIAWLKKDGSKIDTIISPSPSFDEDGNFIESVAVFTDMTKEKEIDRSKSEFVSLAAHQLRTPLTGIEWTIELFSKKEKLTKEGKSYLNDIYLSAKRLSMLIKLLLNVSRIESGSVAIQPEPLDLAGLINVYISEYRAICDKAKISCIFTKHPEKLIAVTDKNLVGYIIQNLISNSISYTPANGKVEISLEEKKDSVFITVQDTGIGIPKREQARIFTKFMRASNAVISKPDGTGLGLYIVRESVNLLGGKIWFESETGEGLPAGRQGTAFFIELPLTTKPRAGEKGLVLQRE